MSSGKVLLGVLAGVAVGATLGIFFAPDKGSKSRKKISQKSKDYMEGLEEIFNEFRENIDKKYETVKEEATHRMSKDGQPEQEEAEAVVNAATK